MIPDVFIAGLPKCGTTSIADTLSLHQDICVSSPKEPSFFDSDLSGTARDYSEYLHYFSHCAKRAIICDASPRTIYSDRAIYDILQANPNAKFIVCVRNPADLCLAIYRQWIFNDFIRDRPLSCALAENPTIKLPGWGDTRPLQCHLDFVVSGIRRIQYLLSLVGWRQVYIVHLDEFKANQALVMSVLGFLDVTPRHDLTLPKSNAAKEIRFRWLQRMARTLYKVKWRSGLSCSLNIYDKLYYLNSKSPSRVIHRDNDMKDALELRYIQEKELLNNLMYEARARYSVNLCSHGDGGAEE